jgi:hypothetical protein
VLGEQVFLRRHGIALNEIVLRLQGRFWQQYLSAPRAVHLAGVG